MSSRLVSSGCVDGGAPGLHFYTLNQAAPTQAVLDRIDLARVTTRHRLMSTAAARAGHRR